MMQCTPL